MDIKERIKEKLNEAKKDDGSKWIVTWIASYNAMPPKRYYANGQYNGVYPVSTQFENKAKHFSKSVAEKLLKLVAKEAVDGDAEIRLVKANIKD